MLERPSPFLNTLRPAALNAPPSGIVEVFDYGRNKPGLLPLWVGEGDLPTPDFISEAARLSLAEGETFYTYQLGLPELRSAIATYLSDLYQRPTGAERIFVTSSGMHAVQIAVNLLAGPGDEMIIPTPAWPNFVGALSVAGARPVEVPMRFSDTGFVLELGAIEAAITPKTRAIVINSPANPTGWTASREELAQLLALARARNLWIIADEIYGQFSFDAPLAPSFREIATQEDRILYIQTFSKNWAMTGWRIGWLEAPAALGGTIANLIQYSSSGVPTFIQRAAIAALEQGSTFIAMQQARARTNRDLLIKAFSQHPRLRFSTPKGAFYLLFRVDGVEDTRALAFKLVDEANVGLAPGSAFGAGGAGFLRLCFLRKQEDIAQAAAQIVGAIDRL
jgi:aspartate/methionine/tyrosine aminotransferase